MTESQMQHSARRVTNVRWQLLCSRRPSQVIGLLDDGARRRWVRFEALNFGSLAMLLAIRLASSSISTLGMIASLSVSPA